MKSTDFTAGLMLAILFQAAQATEPAVSGAVRAAGAVPKLEVAKTPIPLKPDLTVTSQSIQWGVGNKSSSATIKNQGVANAGPFEVYFTPLECPTSANHRPQTRIPVPGLAAGASIRLSADFSPQAHADNNHLYNSYAVEVRVDPKQQVLESNEQNNRSDRPVGYDPSTEAVVRYDEELTTILRGIVIDDNTARELGLAKGYYHVTEYRLSSDASKKAIALHFYKNYNYMNPPRPDEPWVFSIFDYYDTSNATYERVSARDHHGHHLSFQLHTGAQCFQVEVPRLNCTTPVMTAQTYTSYQFYTCGMTEPAWSPLMTP